jgi:hypothetical protein
MSVSSDSFVNEFKKKYDELAKEWTSDQKNAGARYKALIEAFQRFMSTIDLARELDNDHGPGIKKKGEDGSTVVLKAPVEFEKLRDKWRQELGPTQKDESYFYSRYGKQIVPVPFTTNFLLFEANQRLEIYEVRCGTKEAYQRYVKNWPKVEGSPKEMLAWAQRWNGTKVHTIHNSDMKKLEAEYEVWKTSYYKQVEQAMWCDIFQPTDTFEKACRKLIARYDPESEPKGETIYDTFVKHMCGG